MLHPSSFGPLAAALAPAWLLLAPGLAQSPELLHYTFDNGNLANSAPGGPAQAVSGTSFVFTNTSLCGGPGGPGVVSSGPAALIRTGWSHRFGIGDWSIGCWLDRSASNNDPAVLQILFGTSGQDSVLCHVGSSAEATAATFMGPFGTFTIPGAGEPRPLHLCLTREGATYRAYVDGGLVMVSTAIPGSTNPAQLSLMGIPGLPASGMNAGYEMDDFRLYNRALSPFEIVEWMFCAGGPLGTTYCGPAAPNSTGGPGRIAAHGSAFAADNLVTLEASQLPSLVSAMFLTSTTQGFVQQPGGSAGNLCLGGAIGRFVGPGQVLQTSPAGEASLQIDLSRMPSPLGAVVATQGQTWSFQAWFRDLPVGASASNFTDGLQILVQ